MGRRFQRCPRGAAGAPFPIVQELLYHVRLEFRAGRCVADEYGAMREVAWAVSSLGFRILCDQLDDRCQGRALVRQCDRFCYALALWLRVCQGRGVGLAANEVDFGAVV